MRRPKLKIAIVTDAWESPVNGVVTTLKATTEELRKMGHHFTILSHIGHKTIPCPGCQSMRLALFPAEKLIRDLNTVYPDVIHMVTEGPLGMAARQWCLKNNLTFTSSYHTQFPEYLRLRLPIPTSCTYAWLHRFHSKAIYTLVPTESQKHGWKIMVFAMSKCRAAVKILKHLILIPQDSELPQTHNGLYGTYFRWEKY